MGKIGVQQLSDELLAGIKNDIIDELQTSGSLPSTGGSTITVGGSQPTVTTKGTLWMETSDDLGQYEGNPLGSTLFIKNGMIMEDEIPSDYDPNDDILFDLD